MTSSISAPDADPKIAIGICTYHREAGLAALLEAIQRLQFEGRPDAAIMLVVVDNSPTGTARQFCTEFAARSRFGLNYHNETKKGLANARNAALAQARSLGATHLAFIDDDEVPEPQWIEALIERLEQTDAAAALGPVEPVFASFPADALPRSAYVIRPRLANGFALEGYTCNMIVRLDVVARVKAAFDPRFNELGGEDTMFFRALTQAGERIAWAEDARVHEFVPAQRMSAKWLWRRWFRTGSIEAQFSRFPAASLLGRIENLGKGTARLAYGAGRIIASAVVSGWRRPDRTVASCYTFCRGAGLIANAFGRDYNEYARTNYR